MTAVPRRCTLLVVAVLAVGCGQAERPRPIASLQPCQTLRGDTAECGVLTVPENRVTGRGRTIEIHFIVVRAGTGHARTALVLLAGGPGEGSTAMAGMASGIFRSALDTMDVVAIDQRGTGASHPLPCPTRASADPASVFGHVFDPVIVDRCRTALERDADLTQYTTDAAAADVEDIRASLGYEQLSLYGISYGTRLAQAYARFAPTRVRSMVLDGVVPFDNAIPVTYAASAQQSIDRAFRACSAEPDCRAAHPRLSEHFQSLLRQLDGGPKPATVQPGDRDVAVSVSRGDFGYAVRGLLYFTSVSRVADMIDGAARSGDLSEFAQAYWARAASLEASIATGLHLSVFCSEDVLVPTDAEIETATANTFLGRYLFDEYRHACEHWPRAPLQPHARAPITVRVPTLLVSGFFDPVTPPEFAERVARSLPLARLVVSRTGSHGSIGGCPIAAAAYVIEHSTLDGIPEVCR